MTDPAHRIAQDLKRSERFMERTARLILRNKYTCDTIKTEIMMSRNIIKRVPLYTKQLHSTDIAGGAVYAPAARLDPFMKTTSDRTRARNMAAQPAHNTG